MPSATPRPPPHWLTRASVLRAQVTEWWNALAPEARAPRYSLEQLTPGFGCTAQQLGVALFELGWRRKRVWLEDGPYRRYWMPPTH